MLGPLPWRRRTAAYSSARATSRVYLLARYGNRHGMVSGATGTGKTVSLLVLAEGFSRLGVPVFMARSTACRCPSNGR
jgi:MoxR-like ATPase